jgi:hypothetical protein
MTWKLMRVLNHFSSLVIVKMDGCIGLVKRVDKS